MSFKSARVPRKTLYGVLAISLISLAVGLAFFFDWWPALRGGYGWQWPYEAPKVAKLLHLFPGLVTLAVYALGSWLVRHRQGWLHVGWSVLGSVAVPIALLALLDDPIFVLFSRTISSGITGGHTVGVEIKSPVLTLRHWPALMPMWADQARHVALSPPGWPALYYIASKWLENFPTLSDALGMALRPLQCHNIGLMALSNAQLASAWLGIASPLWVGLTAIPLYLLGRQLADEEVARIAIAWWPLVPALTLFAATPDVVYALVTTSVIYLLWRGMAPFSSRRSCLWLVLSGALAALLMLFSFSPMPLLLLCGLLTLWTWWDETTRPGSARILYPLAIGLLFGLGLLVVWGIYTWQLGHSPLDLLSVAMRLHLALERPYLPWLWLHIWDFAIFVGLPIFSLALMGVCGLPKGKTHRLGLALGLTLLILVLSGIPRGETGRVWIYFMPLVLLVAAAALQRLTTNQRRLLVGSQVFWLLALATTLRPAYTWISLPPTYTEVALPALDSPTVPADVNFSNVLHLIGYQTQYKPGTHSLVVAFKWQALQQMQTPYYFSAVLVAPDGVALPGIHWQPLATSYPTTCWRPEETREQPVVDQIELSLGPSPTPGDWWLSLSAFSLHEEFEQYKINPLPVYLADGKTDIQVGLGPIRVETQQ